jgi:hypothetical protein
MEVLNKIKQVRPTSIEDIAETIVIEVEEGYIFLTEDGQVVGPDHNKDNMVAKAALYLVSIGAKNG